MLHAGRNYTLTVSRVSEFGLYLTDGEGQEVLLPNRYTSLADKVGDTKEVFVYHDSEDRLVATTETPVLRAGEVGMMKVVDKTVHGAFLDWGLHGKDLFLPNRNQQGGVLPGRPCLVYVYEDNVTGRCVATQKLKPYIYNDGDLTVRPHQEVDILVASESPIGWRAVVENRHWGMLYRNQVFCPIALGDRLRATVARITEDNRIDLVLHTRGVEDIRRGADSLLQLLRAQGGALPLNDDSAPEEIVRLTRMSKKAFKRSLGMLLKSGTVAMDAEGIKLRK